MSEATSGAAPPKGPRMSLRLCGLRLADLLALAARGRCGWNLHSAADAAGCKRQLNRAIELLWDEIANDAHAIFAAGRSCNGGTADLAPLHGQIRGLSLAF